MLSLRGLGTSSICDENTHEPLLSNLSLIAETCIRLRREGHRVIIVSSGAIGIGLRRLDLDKRPKRLAAAQVRIEPTSRRVCGSLMVPNRPLPLWDSAG